MGRYEPQTMGEAVSQSFMGEEEYAKKKAKGDKPSPKSMLLDKLKSYLQQAKESFMEAVSPEEKATSEVKALQRLRKKRKIPKESNVVGNVDKARQVKESFMAD